LRIDQPRQKGGEALGCPFRLHRPDFVSPPVEILPLAADHAPAVFGQLRDQSRMPNVHSLRRPTRKLTCRAGWRAGIPRNAVMPARSGAAPGSAFTRVTTMRPQLRKSMADRSTGGPGNHLEVLDLVPRRDRDALSPQPLDLLAADGPQLG